ncbi:MAG: hypothetical protein J5999_03635 [Oscillospiraceae bacterium]|nr:hypothetical protein [Oscillospiraceae bacterium]
MCDMSSLYISQGKAEGIAQGKAEGILEATIKIIRNLYEQKIPIEIIATAAGLTIPETEKFIKENLSAQGG